MLKSRTALAILHRTPLSTSITRPALSLRTLLRKYPLERFHRLQQRKAFSSRASSQLQTITQSRWRLPIMHRTRNVRWQSNKPTQPAAQVNGSQTPQSMSQRFKELSRRYGYAAVGVYLGLSVLDFPFCFLAVRLVGPERIGELEHAIVDTFWNVIGIVLPSMRPEDRTENETLVEAEARETRPPEKVGHHENASKLHETRRRNIAIAS